MQSTTFNGENLAGLVPTIFSPDSEATAAALAADVSRAQRDIMKINRLLFVPEHVPLKEAAGLVKKSRYVRQYSIPIVMYKH